MPNDELLPELIEAVEQQLLSPQTPYVKKTLQRLLDAGIDEAEAKSQIACCLGEEMEQILSKKRGFNEPSYRELLDSLPFEEEPADP